MGNWPSYHGQVCLMTNPWAFSIPAASPGVVGCSSEPPPLHSRAEPSLCYQCQVSSGAGYDSWMGWGRMHLGNGRVWGEGLSRRKKATRYPAALKGNAGQVRATEGERGLGS